MEPYKEFAKHQDIEVTLRGTVLNVAVKLEAILINIVYFSNSEQYQNMSESPSLKLKNLTFGGKITRTKELLAAYHRDLLDENEELFKHLSTFLDIRNKMAHCTILMLDAEANYLQIWETNESETQIQFYKPVEYSRFEIISSVIVMEKILVTTDFSVNSKAALRFATQLASQNKFELTFFHSYYVLIPTSWSNNKISEYKKIEVKKIQNKLDRFGTTTAKLIKESHVPVIAVPNNYEANSISSILYASDLLNIGKELKKVIDFARPLKARVVLLHFSSPYKFVDSKMFEARVKNISRYNNIDVHIDNETHDQSRISIIASILKKTKSSMMIMFTEQKRNLFQKIFLSSKSVKHSFKTEAPLLVYNKA